MTKNDWGRSKFFLSLMSNSRLLLSAGLLGAVGVALGAFGAHALKERLATSGMTTVWDKAVLYHLIHSVALLALAWSNSGEKPIASRWLGRTAWSWIMGILFFSGSLYGLALGGPRWLGPITPLGGVAFIAGWVFVALASRDGRLSKQG